jgi:uncharacterized membrane-anchored protein
MIKKSNINQPVSVFHKVSGQAKPTRFLYFFNQNPKSMKFQYISYTTRIWLMSVILSPVLLGFVVLIEDINSFYSDVFFLYILFLVFGGILSLPAYALFILVNEVVFQNMDKITRPDTSGFIGKLIVSIVGFLITMLTFYYFDENVIDNLAGSYTFMIILGIWYFEPIAKT